MNPVNNILFAMDKEAYPNDEKYHEHLLEQYKLYVEMTDRISQRRQSANTWFLTINTALLTILGTFYTSDVSPVIICLIAIAGGINCTHWWRLVVSYKQMNSGRFKVVHAIENKLPLKIYDAEWEALGRGEDSKVYKPFTHIEQNVPKVFFGLYSLVLIFVVLDALICF